MNSKSLLFSFLVLFLSISCFAQSPVGIWKTIDDETGEARSHVEIYEEGGKFHGKIVKLLNTSETVCNTCSDDRKGAPLVGMKILWDMRKGSGEWKGGKIFSPSKDTEYRCKFWFEDDNDQELKVRGYVYAFFRTQTWHRVK